MTTSLLSSAQLLKKTILAFVSATLVTLVVILPVEYQQDPTGLGQALGLMHLLEVDQDSVNIQNSTPKPETDETAQESVFNINQPHWQSPLLAQQRSVTLTISAHKGIELKALMTAGQRFIYDWKVEGGPVNFDMHGEEALAVEDFTSFWIANGLAAAQGGFTAPFDGSHGWYWYNPNPQPVTLTLSIKGYFQDIYMP